MVGDIDGDGNLEFVFVDKQNNASNARVNAIKYTPGVGLSTLFQASHTDRSGKTAMTLFDFNQDGIMEIVYRDESLLRIINASGKSHRTGNDTVGFYNLYSTKMICGTGYEYPIIADVNGDGAAEIITCGRTSGAASTSLTDAQQETGRLVVIAGIHPWAPARRVWNQFAYNVTNVNEDLTIPQYLFNNATVFTDPNGIEHQPFNNFLQQATTLDQYGRPYTPAADAALTAATATPTTEGDSINITLNYCNQGDNHLHAPYGIAVYQNNYRGTLLWVDTVRTQLDVDSCTTRSFRIPFDALCNLAQSDSLVVALNDMGIGIAQHGEQQPECDTTNNIIKIATPVYHNTGDTTATACETFTWWNTDYTSSTDTPTHTYTNAAGCDSVVTLHLTINHSSTGDTTATACDIFTWWGTNYTTSTDTPTHTYTNAAGCDSVVTLNLTITHNTDSTLTLLAFANELPLTVNGTSYSDFGYYPQHLTNAADCDSVLNIHIVPYPDNVQDVDCQIPVTANAFNMRELFRCDSVHSMAVPYVGDIDGDGVPEIVAPTYYPNASVEGDQFHSMGYRIFNGQTGARLRTFSTVKYCVHGQSSAIADHDGDGQAELYLLGVDMKVHCYSLADGSEL